MGSKIIKKELHKNTFFGIIYINRNGRIYIIPTFLNCPANISNSLRATSADNGFDSAIPFSCSIYAGDWVCVRLEYRGGTILDKEEVRFGAIGATIIFVVFDCLLFCLSFFYEHSARDVAHFIGLLSKLTIFIFRQKKLTSGV